MPRPLRNPHCRALLLAMSFVSIMLFGACATNPVQTSGYVDAVELKLKCRELADQLLATVPNDALQGFVAMPTSFVDENNTSTSSPLGRLMAESMFYEFNQRGFPTREYRLTGQISVVGGRDDLALASNQIVSTGQKWAALLVGTYYVDKAATFINVRLVRASDGLVLRTAQLVLPNTPVIVRMGKTDPPIAPAESKKLRQGQRPQGLYGSIGATPAQIGKGSVRIIQGK